MRDQALDYLRRALGMVSQDESARPTLLTSWSIGTVLNLKGEHDDAVRQFEQILRLSTAAKFHHGEALALLGLCAAHRSLGNLAESTDLGRRALTLARQFELRTVECEALNNLGETAALQDIDHAEKIYEQAKQRACQYSLVRFEARALEGFAHVSLARGQVTDAKRYWERAIDLYPNGMVNAEYARRHLHSLDDLTTTCFRCATAR